MFHMIYFSIIDVRACDLDYLPSIYITLDNIKGQGHMLQVNVKVILGIKYLQKAITVSIFRPFMFKRYHCDTKSDLE